MADPDRSEDDLFHRLQEYVQQLHEGETPDRGEIGDSEIAEMMDCLDALHTLAAPGDSDPSGDNGDDPHQASRLWSEDGQKVEGYAGEHEPDFGEYELLQEIGRGGMGVVYKARQKKLDRLVAIKMILAGHLANEKHIRRLQIEARAAAKLRHPNIVAIHEIGQHRGQHFFAMQLVEGMSLARKLRKDPPDVQAAVQILALVARAVDYLHSEGIVHRDLKPSNILLDHQGRPYVTDFGLAKVFAVDSDLTDTGVIAGTPSYMSPEQAAARHGEVAAHSDVYSLGSILYELLTGRPPFQGETALETLVQVLESEPVPPRALNPRVARELQRICLKCLEKSPHNRYASAGELADDLERFLRGEDIEARPADVWHYLRRWIRRQPALASRVVGLGTVAVVLQLREWLLPNFISVQTHLMVLATIGLWILASIVCQMLLSRGLWPHPVRFAWAAADVICVTAALIVGHAPPGPLLICYPLLIGGAGLWFHLRLVTFMTCCCMAAFLVYLSLQPGPLESPHHHVIYFLSLVVLGFIVGFQVKRVRALSRYYESRVL